MPPALRTLVFGLAAFGTYFAMYAFRKPFTAATWADASPLSIGIDYKTALLIAQVIGYALSKFIGIRVIAETGRSGRARAIIGLIGLAWLAMLLFALLPPPWNIACLFLNGLPLGMIWGLVFSYVEGRRTSELLGAMLCASFILSSGVVKSVAVLWLAAGVPEIWMPFVTGAVFAPLLFTSVAVLEAMPPPDARDIAERIERGPMRRSERAAFLAENGLVLALLVAGYVLLTAVRDIRDNFAAEIWAGLGFRGVASVFSASELPVAAIALAGLGALMLVRNNRLALFAMHGIVIAGALLLAAATLAFQNGLLSPLTWMVLTGAGIYLAYTPFNAMLFDRMIAVVGRAGTAGFLIYIADAAGYVGSVGLLLYRNFGAAKRAWLPFFIDSLYLTAATVTVLTLFSALFLFRQRRTDPQSTPAVAL